MKKEIEVSAKTKEEAIAQAVAELGAPSEASLVITVVREARKGFLGFGAADAVIHAVYQVPDEPLRAAERQPEAAADADAADADAADACETDVRGQEGAVLAREPRSNAEERVEKPRRARGDRSGRSARNPRTEEKTEGDAEAALRPRPEPIDPATATPSEQTAYRFICKLVEDMGLSGVTVAMHPGTNDDMVITVDGKEAGSLIGHHGDTLDALQYLANLAANRKEEGEKREYARITVDVEDYRAKREEALRALARRKGEQVLKYKKSIMMEPMNPYERRIIHSEIQTMEGISTNSIGAENNRRVVIFLEEEGMPTVGIRPVEGKGEKTSGEKAGRSRRRRKPKSERTVDPLAPTTHREPQTSMFGDDDDRDPFDIDLSAALPPEEDAQENDAAQDESKSVATDMRDTDGE